MTDIIRLLLVDDHPVVREGLRSFLGRRPGLEVVGEAADVDSAVREAARTQPYLVLLDLMLPGGGGVAATKRLQALDPAPRVLVLTSFVSDEQALGAVRAGAAGWLGKDVPPAELDSAIRTVARGGSVLDPAVAGRLLSEVGSSGVGGGDGLDQLTAREREVLALLGLGRTNRELAQELYVSEKTVKTHVSSILSKLRLSDRTQAALFAVRHGLVE
jgi:DNA-binding NarL/FixJ family response regulator